jgi:hypothetical protein
MQYEEIEKKKYVMYTATVIMNLIFEEPTAQDTNRKAEHKIKSDTRNCVVLAVD